ALRVVSTHERVREHRVRTEGPQASRAAERARNSQSRRGTAGTRAAGGARGPLSVGNLRRAAPACGTGPGAPGRAEAVTARRTLRGARGSGSLRSARLAR